MQKRVIILGGFGSYPEKNWFPWLKQRLETEGIIVYVPQMPDSLHPRFEQWLPAAANAVGEVNKQTFIIGHSLGGTTALHFLQSLPSSKHIGGLILVASPVRSMVIEELRQLDHFFEVQFNWGIIKDRTNGHITAVYSTNDHRVPIESGHIVRDELDPKYVEIEKGGHLNERSGYREFPKLLEETRLMLGLREVAK